ncbi:hypothetical protein [Streptomyces orinoci]|uniref:Uncharacterized protein n=1 Tax=Streptomyces orinoci TaxID=67339 RepID=A0ABV3JXF1_STRON|nr:hypothetical protein [Streptomyces orinoci]
MNATQQHLLDLYRAAQHGTPAPPAPGTGERQAVREFRTWRRFLAVVDERTAHRRERRRALLRLFRPLTQPHLEHPGHQAHPGHQVHPEAAPTPARPAAPGSPAPAHQLQQHPHRLADGRGRPVQC